ncbi:MAG: hypothetical protein JWP03_3204 [Phycisphaerales bacterium]|nr:hypothetical protein [Phycisphaerales bacterium]
MAATPPPINYAPPPKGIRYHWVRRLIALALLITSCALAIRYGPRLNQRLDLLRCQRAAMGYSAAADHVVYERDPARSTALLRTSSDYWAVYPSDGRPRVPPSHMLAESNVVVDFPPAWRDFYELASPPGRNVGAVLFLHKLRSPGAHERIVAVDGFATGAADLRLALAVFEPGSLAARPRIISDMESNSLQKIGDLRAERVYAGQLDPADPSHFTILYQTANGNGTLDGWLKDDDSVKFEQHE